MSNEISKPVPKHKLPQMSALDNLIGNFQNKIQSLREQQDKITESSNETSLGFIQSGDPTKVYTQIEETLASALEILEMSKQMIDAAPDAESVSAAASVMSSVQSLFREFTSIWQKQLNYTNAVNMENLKLQNKKELERHKMELKLEYFNKTNSHDFNDNKSVPFNTKNFIDALYD